MHSTRENEDDAPEWGQVSEVMLKNIPSRCRELEVLAAVAELGFANQLKRFYLPLQRGGEVLFNKGYAFFGFDAPATALAFRDAMKNHCFRRRSSKAVTVHPVRTAPHTESAFRHALVSVVQDVSVEGLLEQARVADSLRNSGRASYRVTIVRTSL
eukprot:TRINITY_DN12247_c0_g1_i1.p1 TRINITY_DN12247_c0_g1~~TRINITY_DN12247_c0_g1_i1.p1  ORF type:complete len:156 (+),score=21.13 TRINITY_DN12247_c0_g1_i1:50-517(+)